AAHVREAEELEHHAVVAAHHAARDAQARAPIRARQHHREVGERRVAAGGEEAEVSLGQRVGEEVPQTQRHARHQRGEPPKYESRHGSPLLWRTLGARAVLVENRLEATAWPEMLSSPSDARRSRARRIDPAVAGVYDAGLLVSGSDVPRRKAWGQVRGAPRIAARTAHARRALGG